MNPNRRVLRRIGDVRWNADNVLGSEVLVGGHWVRLGDLTGKHFEALINADHDLVHESHVQPGAQQRDVNALKRAVTRALVDGISPEDVRGIVAERLAAFSVEGEP